MSYTNIDKAYIRWTAGVKSPKINDNLDGTSCQNLTKRPAASPNRRFKRPRRWLMMPGGPGDGAGVPRGRGSRWGPKLVILPAFSTASSQHPQRIYLSLSGD